MARSASALPTRQRRRALIALIVAPVATALLLTLIMVSIMNLSLQSLQLGVAARVAGILVLIGLIDMLVLVWPFHAAAFRLRWRAVTTYVFAGAIAGVVATAIVSTANLLVMSRSGATNNGLILTTVLGYAVMLGIPTAFMTWLFWLIRRPDRDRDGDPLSVFE